MNRFLLGSVAILAATTGAYAADMPVKAAALRAPELAPVYSWAGFYLGIEGGGAWGRSQHFALGLPATDRYDVSGGLFGGTVGFNVQASNIVFGLEGDVSWANQKGSGLDIPPFNVTSVSHTEERWLATGRGRLGYAWNNWMVYATGGFAVADIQARVTNPGLALDLAESKTRWGGTVGAGVEAGFGGNWSVKLEYLYVNLEGSRYFEVSGAPVGVAIRDNVPINDHIVRAGLNYRFNWGGPLVARY